MDTNVKLAQAMQNVLDSQQRLQAAKTVVKECLEACTSAQDEAVRVCHAVLGSCLKTVIMGRTCWLFNGEDNTLTQLDDWNGVILNPPSVRSVPVKK